MDEKIYDYWFASQSCLTSYQKKTLRKRFQSASEIWYAKPVELAQQGGLQEKEIEKLTEARRKWTLEREYEKLLGANADFVLWDAPGYPEKLKEIAGLPYAIFYKGRLPDDHALSAAIVGARSCSAYGKMEAMEFAGKLAGAGVEIISGMAKGIDGYGQRAALEKGGRTFAVLGCGVDVCYPREHIGLYEDICKCGGILSELPMGTKPLPYHFPMRNRIISGLADVLLVMEAKEKSGSLITADQALEQGRDIYALPGPVDSALSRGCHRLIAQGAGVLLSPEELLKDLEISGGFWMDKKAQGKAREKGQEKGQMEKMLESSEKLVYSCLGLYPKNLEQIIIEGKVSPEQAMKALMSLQIKGFVQEVSTNYYIASHTH